MGYQVMLTHTYQRKADVVNRGMSARTTRWWLAHLPGVLVDWEHKSPALVTIYLGVNDACSIDGPLAAYHVPLDEFKTNLRTIVADFLAAFPGIHFLLVTPSAVDESSSWGASRNNADVHKYVVATQDVAQELSLAVVDIGPFNCAIEVSSDSTPVFITLGDSETEIAANPALMGYQVQLVHTYQRKADVINRGLSGRTTRWWLAHLPSILADWAQKAPSLITIYLGVNDACSLNGTLPSYHVPVNEFATNLRAMVGNLTVAFPRVKIILITPGAVDEASLWGPSRTNVDIHKYVVQTQTIAQDLRLPLVDIWTPTISNYSLFYDGLHLNAQGHTVLHDRLLHAIRTELPQLAPESLPWAF
ncbi:hypothetical protein ACHHYP_12389 [Achlya hypogyna]|uniref:SGNH hydrolase-type esterase domain-containing protein n=1 Tax=Achlya hypogyna TaxID=1202772 RepID=A0A1V9YHB5_ACHHY|nr:hypothetical protein ACHHYP_12389 [Achlya hypogyna]